MLEVLYLQRAIECMVVWCGACWFYVEM